jgi:hypothetical protein
LTSTFIFSNWLVTNLPLNKHRAAPLWVFSAGLPPSSFSSGISLLASTPQLNAATSRNTKALLESRGFSDAMHTIVAFWQADTARAFTSGQATAVSSPDGTPFSILKGDARNQAASALSEQRN